MLDKIEELPIEEQQFIEEELHRRITQSRRDRIAKKCEQVYREYKVGTFKKGTAKQLLQDLND